MPCFSSFLITEFDHLLRLAHLEIEGVDVGREGRDVALGKVAQQRRRVLEVREAEERREWSGDRRMQSTDPHLDLLLGLLDVAGVRLFGQILVRPGMATYRVAGSGHLLGDFGVPYRVLADLEERGLEAIVGKRLEHGRRIARPGAVVEGQHNFPIAQEIVLLEMLEAEARSAGRVNLNYAREAHSARFVADRDVAAGNAGSSRRRCCR